MSSLNLTYIVFMYHIFNIDVNNFMEKLELKQNKKYKEPAPLSKTITKYSLLISMILLSSCSGKELPKT